MQFPDPRPAQACCLATLMLVCAPLAPAQDPYFVADVRPGAADSAMGIATGMGSLAFFVADDGVHGRELWRSDGTPAGTYLLLDLAPGAASSEPQG
ncbi:MAG: ELWxxDGT repeat protein, partial [Planctomycetia bacterium]